MMKKIVKISQCGGISPYTNQFAVINSYKLDEFDWISCRDEFAEEFNEDTKSIAFSTNKPMNIVKFINRIENVLKLPKSKRTRFARTNYQTVLCIKPSKFWREHAVKRSLFTALIRAGEKFNKGYKEAIGKSKYFKDRGSRMAFDRFMKKHTKIKIREMYPPASHGWLDTFSEEAIESYDEIKKILVKK